MGGYARTKTGQGFLPFRGVHVEGHSDSPGFHPGDTLVFDTLSARDCAMIGVPCGGGAAPGGATTGEGAVAVWEPVASDGGARLHPGDAATLVNLGSCMVGDGDGGWVPHEKALLALAGETGPLFGDDAGREAYRSWAYAADAAMLAIRIQECVNGKRPIGTFSSLGRINKMSIAGGSDFGDIRIVGAMFRLPAADMPAAGRLPLVRRTVGEGAYRYAFASEVAQDETDALGLPLVECLVVSLSEEMSDRTFQLLQGTLGLAPELSRRAGELLDIGGDSAQGGDFGRGDSERDGDSGQEGDFEPDGEFLSEVEVVADVELDAEDVPSLEALVQAMAAVHLAGARVDVFQGDRTTGFLSFDSLYTWMWYDFAHEASVAAIGYCEHCGCPFSLVGHRGIERRYCSDACKTAAKNERGRKDRDKSRKLFLEGASVERIAALVHPGRADGPVRVRTDLSKWVFLKHRLADDLEQGDLRLLRRCRDEGLDMAKLLSARQIKRLVGMS